MADLFHNGDAYVLEVPLIEDSQANGLSLLVLQSLICPKVNMLLYSSFLTGRMRSGADSFCSVGDEG